MPEERTDHYTHGTVIPVKINTKVKAALPPTPPAPKKRWFLRFSVYLTIFALTGLAVFSSQVLMSEQTQNSWLAKLPIVRELRQLAESANRQLKGEDLDRINILLLGMGGKNHDGGYLTDTIMLASLQPSTGKAALVSIPRDLAVPVENMGWKKINAINAYAENAQPGSGGLATSQAFADDFGVPIDYFIRVDFDGFINIVDQLGGVDVNVERVLDDYRYPAWGQEDNPDYEARYEHLHLDAGQQHLDGATALKYARSRHGLGAEGSDFARAKRQQLIIEAVKNKVVSERIYLKPALISEILNEIQDHVSTNLKLWEILKLWELFRDTTKERISNKVIDNSPNGLLVDKISAEGAYILEPRSGDFAELHYFIANVFSDAPADERVQVANEKTTIEVRNGTWVNGLASQVALDLERYGFTVIRIGNSSRQNFERSVIYDLTYGEKAESLTVLRKRTGANVSFGLPDWLVEEIKTELNGAASPVKPDFIVVIGQNADATDSGLANPTQ